MLDEGIDTFAPRQVELAIGRLESLSTLPCIAVQYFSKFSQSRFSSADLADLVESDPALAAKIFSLSHQQGVNLPGLKFSLRLALDALPASLVREATLSVKVSAAFEPQCEPGQVAVAPGKELLLHSLAVACCAQYLAEILPARIEPKLAYYAGLLHDIGKLALQEIMPKSFIRIIQEAKSAGASSCAVEQKYLGTDHSALGRILAQRWHLPEAIGLGIWLHHSDTEIIAQNVPEAGIAHVVQCADSIARLTDVGQSGSFDSPEPVQEIARALAVTSEQLQQIRNRLPEAVREKTKVLGLDLPNAAARYCQSAHAAAARFAHQQAELSQENRQLLTASSHLNFTTDFLLSVSPTDAVAAVAENFATRWQRFYQTGAVCLYLATADRSESIDAVVVESLGQGRTLTLNVPADSKPIPETIANRFAVLDASDYVAWLFEQLDAEFDQRHTKLVPLLSNRRAVGAIVFELHWPADAEQLGERFEKVTSIAGMVLDAMLNRHRYERFAERFAQLIATSAKAARAARQEPAYPSEPEAGPAQMTPETALDALAEMAAGVAHELNNPLSIISGRAQLLAEAETEQKKKRTLEQIQENTRKASAVIDDLMSFAEPAPPKPSQIDVKQMLDEAIQLASLKTGAEHINVQMQIAKEVKSVFVDSAQVVSALANILSNALESYRDKMGPIKITAGTTDDCVRLQISDLGCGMDAQTLRKATHPFFSAKPAGRKRGMGLAYAARLLQQNKAALSIESEPGKGTTVTIHLPTKQSS
jgi:putative nucleotidyltransferase with HDIG domain